jgi:hypothetical protein
MPSYIQPPGSDTWHWCRNCSDYPSRIGATERLPEGQRPSDGELCNECRDAERDGRCEG